jgi:hypothetical protein
MYKKNKKGKKERDSSAQLNKPWVFYYVEKNKHHQQHLRWS